MIETTPKWQTLTDEDHERTEVLRVAGGWLYRTRLCEHATSGAWISVALAFQPERS